MFQTIGAYLDSLLFIGAGVFALLAPKRMVSPTMQGKMIVLRIAGAVLVLAGLFFFFIKLAENG